MVVVIFKHRMEPGVGQEYGTEASKLLAIVQTIPGFASVKSYAADDGEQLVLAEFESEQALAAWREHPAHLIAQERGRSKYYSEYKVQVCTTVREYGFKAPGNA